MNMKLKHVFFALASLIFLVGCDKSPEITGIAIDPDKVTIEGVGNTATVTAVVAPEDAKTSNIKWSSSNTAIVTVEGDGATAVITAIGKGTAKVVVTADIFTAECEVLVKDEGEKELGSESAPYNVEQAITNQNGEKWVEGYIVGNIDGEGKSITTESKFEGTFTVKTNILIADVADETDHTKCIPVQLPSGAVRNGLNIVENPDNIGEKVKLYGSLEKYFLVSGLKSVTYYEFEDGTSGGTKPVDASNLLFFETLLTQTSFDKFTAVSVKGDQAWKFDKQYGAVMSGFADGKSHENEDWFISPAIDLAGKSGVKLAFDHARGPAAEMSTGIAEGWYKVYATADYKDVATTTWVELEGVVHGTTAWGYVSSGALEIPASAISANTRIAFKYLCSDAKSATWEIKNMQVGQ